MFTLQDVYNTWYWIIAQWQDSTAYPLDLFKTFVNKAQNDICYGNIANLQSWERIDKQALTFLEKNQFYTTYNYATLADDTTIWATSITCTNVFPNSGYLWFNGNIISYTGNDGSTISWIPATWEYAIQFAFQAWTQIFFLNELPADFWQPSRIFLTLDWTRARVNLISVDNRNLSSPVPDSYIYRFFYDKWYSTWTWVWKEWYYSLMRWRFVLFLVPQINSQAISFEYQKKPTQLVNPGDALTIPDDYSLNTIPYMAVSEMLANRGDIDQAVWLNNFGFQNIKSMYQFYQTQRAELPYWQRVRTSSDGFMNF